MKQLRSFIMLFIAGLLYNLSFGQDKMAAGDPVTVGGVPMYRQRISLKMQ
jgi:hypothetical protein